MSAYNPTSCTLSGTQAVCYIKLNAGGTAESQSIGYTTTGTVQPSPDNSGNFNVVTLGCSQCSIFTTADFTDKDGGANLPAVAASLGLGSFTDGFEAGDAICQYNAEQNSYTGTYKALIAGTNRQPGGSDWVIKANTPYVRGDGSTVVGTSTAGAQLPATLTNSISTSMTSALTGFAYGSDPWTVDAVNGNCSNWTAATSGTWVNFGNPSTLNSFAQAMLAPPLSYLAAQTMQGAAMPVGCNSRTSVLYCVHQ